MIVGVDPKNTDLSPKELEKAVVQSVTKLNVLSGVGEIYRRADGSLRLRFYDNENYESDVYVKDGLVIIDYSTPKLEEVQIPNCEKYIPHPYKPGYWHSLCVEGCGCGCVVDAGFMELDVHDPSLRPYHSHCKDFDIDKIPKVEPPPPRPQPTGPQGPIGMTGTVYPVGPTGITGPKLPQVTSGTGPTGCPCPCGGAGLGLIEVDSYSRTGPSGTAR